MIDKKMQRAREQKGFRIREKSLNVSVTGDWKSTLRKRRNLGQSYSACLSQSVGGTRIYIREIKHEFTSTFDWAMHIWGGESR